jgi:hypothetical protein
MKTSPEIQGTEQFTEMDSDFGRVAELALAASKTTNHLEIPHAVLRSKTGQYMGLLVAAHSDLIATGKAMRHDPHVQDGIAIHETTHHEMSAVATMVGLWPYANEGNGEATIFQVETTYTPQAERAVMPLAAFALRLYGQSEQPTNEAFDTTAHARHGDGYIFATYNEPLPVLATDKTHLEATVTGHQEVTHEVGARAILTGHAQVWLGRQGLVRIKDDSIYMVDPSMRMAEITLPEDGSMQSGVIITGESPTDTYDGLFTYTDQGYIMVSNGEGTLRDETNINPQISLDEAASLLTEPILWADVTDTFLRPHDPSTKAAAILALGTPGQRLDALFAGARDRLLAEQPAASMTAISGTAVVAAMIQILSKKRAFNTVDSKYYAPN